MGERFIDMLLSIFVVAAGVAVVALVLSKNSATSQVIQAWFSGNSNLLAVAVSPQTGNDIKTDLSYPSSGFGSLSMPNL